MKLKTKNQKTKSNWLFVVDNLLTLSFFIITVLSVANLVSFNVFLFVLLSVFYVKDMIHSENIKMLTDNLEDLNAKVESLKEEIISSK